MLAEIVWPADQNPLAFVCGPTNFVETVAGNLVALGTRRGVSKPNGSEGPDGRA